MCEFQEDERGGRLGPQQLGYIRREEPEAVRSQTPGVSRSGSNSLKSHIKPCLGSHLQDTLWARRWQDLI